MKKKWIKIIIAFILFLIALITDFSEEWLNKIIFIISYFIVGLEILNAEIFISFSINTFPEPTTLSGNWQVLYINNG